MFGFDTLPSRNSKTDPTRLEEQPNKALRAFQESGAPYLSPTNQDRCPDVATLVSAVSPAGDEIEKGAEGLHDYGIEDKSLE